MKLTNLDAVRRTRYDSCKVLCGGHIRKAGSRRPVAVCWAIYLIKNLARKPIGDDSRVALWTQRAHRNMPKAMIAEPAA